MERSELVAEVTRNDVVEGRHYGSVVATTGDGSVAWSVGDATSPIFPRSCNKPLQALAMVEAGLDLPSDLLALACASHSGEAIHVDAVTRILAVAGLDESALRNTADYPLDDVEKDATLRAGGKATRLLMNCSGKHAAMLLTCVVNDWDLEGYLDPTHPLQLRIADTFARATGEPIAHHAVDGCGAPLLSSSLTGLARAFRHLAVARSGPAREIADAIRSHPDLVSGTRRDEAALIRAVPGAITKAGAEACQVVALSDGRALALKIDDGGIRARPAVMAAALLRAGIETLPGVDLAAVRATGERLIHGGGQVVGRVRATI